jgi:DNA-binding transcriptional LysR family regulator
LRLEKQLLVLQTIARCGKIANAANALGVTPPAVTLQLKLLEEAAGAASI